MENFKEHEVIWTRDKIINFWNYFVLNEGLRELSFAGLNGRGILKIAKKYIKKNAEVLDYGCGGGNFMELLFKNGIQCTGVDASDKSLIETKKRFENQELFRGVISSNDLTDKIERGKFDFVFLIETLEHLLEKDMESIIKELHRIIKPDGFLLITTPNNENLDKYKVICPDCGAIFHRVQHVNRFTAEKLVGIMEENNFEKEFCMATYLGKDNSLLDKLKYVIGSGLFMIRGKSRHQPHLVYLGRKK